MPEFLSSRKEWAHTCRLHRLPEVSQAVPPATEALQRSLSSDRPADTEATYSLQSQRSCNPTSASIHVERT